MTPYTTRSGVQVGLLYVPPQPRASLDMLRLQSALLDERTTGLQSWVARVFGAVWWRL